MTYAQLKPLRMITYQIDQEDYLQHMNEQWDSFAFENKGEQLSSTKVINRSLWEFITGTDVRRIYQVLLQRVRASKKAVRFPYRCDSPEMKRYMHMSIVPFQTGSDIQMYSREIKLVPQKSIANLHFVNDHNTLLKAYLRCSMCNGYYINGEWIEIEDAVQRENIFDVDGRILVMSSVCGKCSSRLMAIGTTASIIQENPAGN